MMQNIKDIAPENMSPDIEKKYWDWVREVIKDCITTEALCMTPAPRLQPFLDEAPAPDVITTRVLKSDVFLLTHTPHGSKCSLNITHDHVTSRDSIHQLICRIKTLSEKSVVKPLEVTIDGDFEKGPYTVHIHANSASDLAKGLNQCIHESQKISLPSEGFQDWLKNNVPIGSRLLR